MLDGCKDLLRCQPPEVLAGVVMAEPDQKASSAQKCAIAGFGFKTPDPAQITRIGGEKRGVRIIDDAVRGDNESFRRHSPRVLKR